MVLTWNREEGGKAETNDMACVLSLVVGRETYIVRGKFGPRVSTSSTGSVLILSQAIVFEYRLCSLGRPACAGGRLFSREIRVGCFAPRNDVRCRVTKRGG